jgi:ClpP class serine protease
MIETVIIALLVIATTTFAVLWRLERSELADVLSAKHSADDKCAAAYTERDAAVARRAEMERTYDPLLASVIKLRERHSDALNELHEEAVVHKQRAHTLSLVIEKMLPDMAISDARKQMILKQIQPEAMLAEYSEMIGANDGEAERTSSEA